MIRSRALIALSLALVAFSLSPVPALAAAHWWDYARRFTGEDDKVRDAAVGSLRKIPTLNAELKKALGTTEHFLALDVITTLGLKEMMTDLLAFAEKDKTGYSYHVISSLIEAKDHDRVGHIYLDRIDNPKTSAAAKIAMIDAAARMEITIGPERTERLLKDESPEVRASVLSLFRTELLRRNFQRGLSVLETTIRDPAFQIRMQTLFLVSELPGSLRRANLSLIDGVLQSCSEDAMPQVKSFCLTLKAGEAK